VIAFFAESMKLMDYYNRLQHAVNFIEENLDQPFSLTDVSKAAFSSLSYLHRVFYFMTGLTVKEYIRKRRLSKAAFQLHCTDLAITDIAFQAGFETLESFTRAFKKNFGLSPRDFRKTNQEFSLFEKIDIVKNYAAKIPPLLDFKLALEFVLYKETQVAGFQIHTTIESGQQAVDICQFANEIMSTQKLTQYFDLSKTPVFGIYTNMTDENEFDYTIGCLKSSAIKTDKTVVSHIIPTSQYAKFSLNRADRVKEAWHYIYGVWFPENQKFRAPGFDFEIYFPESVDIYIPIHTVPEPNQ
jgi:AraC family transcriptional regulator